MECGGGIPGGTPGPTGGKFLGMPDGVLWEEAYLLVAREVGFWEAHCFVHRAVGFRVENLLDLLDVIRPSVDSELRCCNTVVPDMMPQVVVLGDPGKTTDTYYLNF